MKIYYAQIIAERQAEDVKVLLAIYIVLNSLMIISLLIKYIGLYFQNRDSVIPDSNKRVILETIFNNYNDMTQSFSIPILFLIIVNLIYLIGISIKFIYGAL